MKKNPYSLVFGKEPAQYISRFMQTDEVIENFLSDPPPQQIYMITGVRGSGKTVLMTDIAKKFESEKGWIVADCNPNRDVLQGLASNLYHDKRLTAAFKSAKINLSFFGIGVEISRTEPITDIEVALARILEEIRTKGKKVLVLIDEASNTQQMREFASSFQMMIRKGLPIYLLMTGLYENIDALQNVKTLTFLHRAPKIRLKPLNLTSMAANYQKMLPVSEEDAGQMARLTRGYSFAFQVLGYFTHEYQGDYREAVTQCRQYIEEYVYDKLWSELTHTDRHILYALTMVKSGKVGEIRDYLDMKANVFSPYRDKLIKKGLVSGDAYGYLSFTLPFFDAYVKAHWE